MKRTLDANDNVCAKRVKNNVVLSLDLTISARESFVKKIAQSKSKQQKIQFLESLNESNNGTYIKSQFALRACYAEKKEWCSFVSLYNAYVVDNECLFVNLYRLFRLDKYTHCALKSAPYGKHLVLPNYILNNTELGILCIKNNESNVNERRNISNIEVLKCAMEKCPFLIKNLPIKLVKNNRELLMIAIRKNGLVLTHIHSSIKEDIYMYLTAARTYPRIFIHANEEFRINKHILLDFINENPEVYRFTKQFMYDDDVISIATDHPNFNLMWLPSSIRNNRHLVLKVIANNERSLKFALLFNNDEEIVSKSVSKHGTSLKYASRQLKFNKKIVLLAVNNNGLSLEYASELLKNDYETVYQAVLNNGHALKYASELLKNDRHIVLSAVKNRGRSLQFASNELKSDKEIVLAAVKNCGMALYFASDTFKNDIDFIHMAIRNDPTYIECVRNNDLLNRGIILEAVSKNGRLLKYVHKNFKRDKEIIHSALKNDIKAICYIPKDLKYETIVEYIK